MPYPKLDFFGCGFVLANEKLGDLNKASSKLFVDHLDRNRPMTISKTICVKPELFDLIENKRMLSILFKKRAQILELPRALHCKFREQPLSVLASM